MREVGASEARTHLSALLAGIEAGGDPVVITRRGKPAAQLSPIPKGEAIGWCFQPLRNGNK